MAQPQLQINDDHAHNKKLLQRRNKLNKFVAVNKAAKMRDEATNHSSRI